MSYLWLVCLVLIPHANARLLGLDLDDGFTLEDVIAAVVEHYELNDEDLEIALDSPLQSEDITRLWIQLPDSIEELFEEIPSSWIAEGVIGIDDSQFFSSCSDFLALTCVDGVDVECRFRDSTESCGSCDNDCDEACRETDDETYECAECPANSEFTTCGDACSWATCTRPNGADVCSASCLKHCQCDEGYIFNQDTYECVREEERLLVCAGIVDATVEVILATDETFDIEDAQAALAHGFDVDVANVQPTTITQLDRAKRHSIFAKNKSVAKIRNQGTGGFVYNVEYLIQSVDKVEGESLAIALDEGDYTIFDDVDSFIGVGDVTFGGCPPGKPPVNCFGFADPCEVTTCPAHPQAQCEADYCGGCNARFYDSDGQLITDCDKTVWTINFNNYACGCDD